MSNEKKHTIILIACLNAKRRYRELTDLEKLEYETLLLTMPKE